MPARSVAENVFLGIERSTFGVLRGSVLDRYRELDERVGFGLPGDVPVSSLRLADQQKVEIMRALARNARLIVLDEPTSSLSQDESQRLQQLIRDLRSHGRTPRLRQPLPRRGARRRRHRDDHARRARHAHRRRRPPRRKDSLVARHARPPARGQLPGRPAGRRRRPCRARGRERCAGRSRRTSTSAVRAGEIVGLAGLVGSGRTELARMIAGADPITSGELLLDGVVLPRLRPHGAIRRGVVMLPEDRRALGLVMTQNVRENVTPAAPADVPPLRCRAHRRRTLGGALRDRTAAHRAPDPDGALPQLLRRQSAEDAVRQVDARPPALIVLDEPTRGVDIGAKRRIYEAIVEVAASGAAVVADLLRARGGARHRAPHAADEPTVGSSARSPPASSTPTRRWPASSPPSTAPPWARRPADDHSNRPGCPCARPRGRGRSTAARSDWRAPPPSAGATGC